MSLVQALSTQFEITRLNRKTLTAYAEITNNETLQTLLLPDNRSELMQLIDTHQLIDLLTRYPARIPLSAQQFVDMLRPLTPRLYSIASSPAAYEGEVHLTVAVVEYQAFGHTRVGAASHYLGRHLAAGDRVAIYAEANPGFRLPPDEADMIMIGPGTGVAPFRAFLDERAARGASGSNWLFFGDRTFADDFLYQVEWQRHLKSGVLSYLDVAFSRDQSDKIYVQHRLKQRGKQLYRWLNEGAHIYVCGDAKNMAPDVHAALLELIQEHGNLSVTEAEALLKTLRRQGRYHRDVY